MSRTAIGLLVLAGCIAVAVTVLSSASSRELHDYSIEVPPAWTPWEGEPPLVPATVLEAYRVPTRAGVAGSLVIGRSPYVPRTSIAELIEARRFLHISLPGLKIHRAVEIKGGARPAALLEFTASGIGTAIAPTGLGKPVAPGGQSLVPTRSIRVSVPRGPELGTLEVFLHCPESAVEEVLPMWKRVLGSL